MTARSRTDAERLAELADAATRLRAALARAIVGQGDVVDAMLVTLVARGHAFTPNLDPTTVSINGRVQPQPPVRASTFQPDRTDGTHCLRPEAFFRCPHRNRN